MLVDPSEHFFRFLGAEPSIDGLDAITNFSFFSLSLSFVGYSKGLCKSGEEITSNQINTLNLECLIVEGHLRLVVTPSGTARLVIKYLMHDFKKKQRKRK